MPILSPDLAAALNDKVINEAFDIARSNRTGILQVVGVGGPRQAYEGHKTSWLDFRIDATSSATTAAVLIGDTTVPVVDGTKFRPGMTLSPVGSEEILLVTAVSGNNLTVATRGFGGSTAAALADEQVLVIDSVGREENSGAANDGIFQPEPIENFFQTMDTAIEFGRRALATMQFGGTNDLAFQVSERIRQLTIQMDRALVRGRRASATVDSKTVTYTGGMRFYITESGGINTNASGALTVDRINIINAEIVSRGGMANTIAVGVKQARILSAAIAASYSSQRLSEFVADQGALVTLPSDLPLVGNVNTIVVDTNLADDELLIFDSSMISVVPMASNNAESSGAWRTLDATQPGQDGQRVRVIGDFAMEVRQSKTHMGRLFGLT